MSAFVISAVKRVDMSGFVKTAFITVTGTASYDIGGSILDLSSANAVLAAAGASFTRVDAVDEVGADAVTPLVYKLGYVRATDGAPATGKVVVFSGASQASSTTDFSTYIYHFRVQGQ